MKFRRQFFVIFVASSLLLSIILITIVLCFVDRLHKRFQTKKSNEFYRPNHSHVVNGKRIANSSPIKSRFSSDDDSPTHHYTNLKTLKPVIIIASSSSSTSIDSVTRLNTEHNRILNSSYSYTPIATSDELMPMEYDDATEENMSGIELMMTTV